MSQLYVYLSITVLSMLFVNFNSYSQNCDYKINETDKFSGVSHSELEPVLLQKKYKSEVSVLNKISMVLSKKGEDRTFSLQYIYYNKSQPIFSGMGDCKLICLLESGETVELQMKGRMSDVIKSEVTTHFNIPEKAFDLLQSDNITDIKAIAMMNGFEFTVEENKNTKIYFDCIK